MKYEYVSSISFIEDLCKYLRVGSYNDICVDPLEKVRKIEFHSKIIRNGTEYIINSFENTINSRWAICGGKYVIKQEDNRYVVARIDHRLFRFYKKDFPNVDYTTQKVNCHQDNRQYEAYFF